MHTWRSLIALALFVSVATPAAVVYKWVDAQGVVHFSDQPEPGAEKVPLVPAPTHGMPNDTRNASGRPQRPREEAKKVLPRLGYTEITVTEPQAGKTYVDEPVRVTLNLSPDLQAGHTLTWFLNESPLGETEASFVIDRLDRGAYTLYATVTDTATQETATSNVVTFYVRQPSVLSPQYPKK